MGTKVAKGTWYLQGWKVPGTFRGFEKGIYAHVEANRQLDREPHGGYRAAVPFGRRADSALA